MCNHVCVIHLTSALLRGLSRFAVGVDTYIWYDFQVTWLLKSCYYISGGFLLAPKICLRHIKVHITLE